MKAYVFHTSQNAVMAKEMARQFLGMSWYKLLTFIALAFLMNFYPLEHREIVVTDSIPPFCLGHGKFGFPFPISAYSWCFAIREFVITYLPELTIAAAPVVLGNLLVAYLIVSLPFCLYRVSIKRNFSL
jgi:hypothetical protein